MVNSYTKSILDVSNVNSILSGPSHIELWVNNINKNKINHPEKFVLFPIPAVSLFSDQLKKLFIWSNDFYKKFILFVPDFRIGNSDAFESKHDSKFISQECISEENSIRCYELGLNRLDFFKEYAETKQTEVKLIFWCLHGREFFNKSKGKFVIDNKYRHPIWNYSDMIERYKDIALDVCQCFSNIDELVVDNSIHPKIHCYKMLEKFISENI